MIGGGNGIHASVATWLMRRTPLSGARRVMPVSAALATDVGSVREDNEDKVAILRGRDLTGRPLVLVALSDGIGGMKAGAECAALTIGCFFAAVLDAAQSSIEPEAWLSTAAFRANLAVHSKFDGSGGATLAAVLIRPGISAHWLSVGDSRVYRSNETSLTQLSVDDTIAGQLGKPNGSGLGQTNLLQFIGMGRQLEPHISDADPLNKGAFLLTSDGVHYLDANWLGQVVGNSPDPGACVRRLVELAKWCGGPDNASAAYVTADIPVDAPVSAQAIGIEVWDSFGELQILIPRDRRALGVPKGAAGDELPGPLVENHGRDYSAAEVPKMKGPTAKSKRNRSARKPSRPGKTPGDLGAGEDADRTEVPQLHIDFPKKDS